MPRVNPLSASGIFERLVLQPRRLHAESVAGDQQPFPIGRHEVCHPFTLPHVLMKPETTPKGVAHAIATTRKLEPLLLPGFRSSQ